MLRHTLSLCHTAPLTLLPPSLPPYQVEPDGVLRGLRSLRAAGTPARTLILDDGWQTVTPPEAATADGGDGGGGEGGGGVNAANAAAPPPLPLLARVAARASAALLGALSAVLQATPPYRAKPYIPSSCYIPLSCCVLLP